MAVQATQRSPEQRETGMRLPRDFLALSCMLPGNELSPLQREIVDVVIAFTHAQGRTSGTSPDLTRRTLRQHVRECDRGALRTALKKLLRRRILVMDGWEGLDEAQLDAFVDHELRGTAWHEFGLGVHPDVSAWDGVDIERFNALRRQWSHLEPGRGKLRSRSNRPKQKPRAVAPPPEPAPPPTQPARSSEPPATPASVPPQLANELARLRGLFVGMSYEHLRDLDRTETKTPLGRMRVELMSTWVAEGCPTDWTGASARALLQSLHHLEAVPDFTRLRQDQALCRQRAMECREQHLSSMRAVIDRFIKQWAGANPPLTQVLTDAYAKSLWAPLIGEQWKAAQLQAQHWEDTDFTIIVGRGMVDYFYSICLEMDLAARRSNTERSQPTPQPHAQRGQS